MAFAITSSCIGCGACRKICPAAAISGNPKEIHTIDPALCLECGACGRVCPKGAVQDDNGKTILRVKKEKWARPRINEANCFACENCVAACPTGALAMKEEDLPLKENYAVLSGPELCVSCGWCEINCQFNAITMEIPEESRKEAAHANH